jgi:hypothetical protein
MKLSGTEAFIQRSNALQRVSISALINPAFLFLFESFLCKLNLNLDEYFTLLFHSLLKI